MKVKEKIVKSIVSKTLVKGFNRDVKYDIHKIWGWQNVLLECAEHQLNLDCINLRCYT